MGCYESGTEEEGDAVDLDSQAVLGQVTPPMSNLPSPKRARPSQDRPRSQTSDAIYQQAEGTQVEAAAATPPLIVYDMPHALEVDLERFDSTDSEASDDSITHLENYAF